MGVISRREVLKLGMAGVAAWLLGGNVPQIILSYEQSHSYDFATRVWLDRDSDHLSFDEVAQMAIRLAKISATYEYKPDIGIESIWELSRIIQRHLVTSGVVKGEVTAIKVIEYSEKLRGTGHVAISDCIGAIYLNSELVDQNSLYYQSPFLLPTLVHEIFHLQQGRLCEAISMELIENAAQIVSWVVLADMANSSDIGKDAAFSLVIELREIALCTAIMIALRGSNPSLIPDLILQMFPRDQALAKLDWLMDKIENEPDRLVQTFQTYAETPLATVIKAHQDTADKITGLPLTPDGAQYIGGGSPYVFNDEAELNIGGLMKFWSHAGEIVSGFRSIN